MSRYIRVDNLEAADYITVWDCDCSEYGEQTVMAVDDLWYLPVADAVEVVRCSKCKHWSYFADEKVWGCCLHDFPTNKDDFCSFGEGGDDDGLYRERTS